VTRLRPLLTPALLFAATFVACGEPEPKRPFDVAAVERRTLEITAEASGVIEPVTVVEVKSKASGEIIEMPVDVGDDVARGQLLVHVEETELRQNLAQAEADLDVARARLNTAESALRRAQEMVRTQVITQQEFEQAALEHANANAQFVRAQAALEIARERLAEATVRAPLDGTVIEKSAEVGQVISSPTRDVGGGTVLLRMADLTQVQVRTLVDETDIGKIQPEQPVEIRVEAFSDRTFEGNVLKVEPQAVVQQSVTMFPVIVRIENRARLLKPGMTAEVTFLIARRENVLAVPNQAVHTPEGAGTVAELALGMPAEQLSEALAQGRAALDGDAAGDGGGEGARAPSNAPAGLTAAQRDSLRERFRRGEMTPEEMRRLREPSARSDGGGGGQSSGRRRVRELVVFVMREGRPVPAPVRVGLTDWDYSELVSGLQEGDSVALLPSAGLLRDQSELLERFQRFRQGVPGMRQSS
jgi:HlyD family secretion protein